MLKPKSLAMMNTQPLNNNYIDFKNTQKYQKLIPERQSAISLQIGGGTYNQYQNKTNSRISQKAKTRSGSNKLFMASKNPDNYNIRYTKYHQIYSNKVNGPIRAIQKKNEKMVNHKISSMDEIARGRKEHKRPGSNKRKSYSNKNKRPTSPKAGAFYGKIMGVERPKFITKPTHQKIASATQGFEFYKQERAYAENRPVKAKQQKKPSSK